MSETWFPPITQRYGNSEALIQYLSIGEPKTGHHDDNGGKLQQHAPAHQVLRAVGRAAAHHVPQAQKQDHGYGPNGERHEIVKNIHRLETLLPFHTSCEDNGVLEPAPT